MKKSDKLKNIRNQILFLILVLCLWQAVYQLNIFPKLMFPSVTSVIQGVVKGFTSDNLGEMVLYSMSLIGRGMAAGILLAFFFSGLSIVSNTVYSIYNMIVSLCDLLPGVALLPLAILWFGVGEETIIAIVIHSVIWPVSRSILDGFQEVPQIYIEAGMNIGLSKWRLVTGVYVPAAFSSILSGIKIGWARAWRGLISAEMIFGTTSSGAGIGWFIFMKRTNMDIAGVFGALLVIIVIGIIVEYVVFQWIDKKTIRKWGIN